MSCAKATLHLLSKLRPTTESTFRCVATVSLVVLPELMFQEGDVLVMASHLLRALDFLHSNRLVHRDVCLSNLLFVKEGDQIRYKLTDLGLCCTMEAPSPYLVVRTVRVFELRLLFSSGTFIIQVPRPKPVTRQTP